jgi:hypothetical protein
MDAWTQYVGHQNRTTTSRRETMVRPRVAQGQQTLQNVTKSAGKDEQPELNLAGLEL